MASPRRRRSRRFPRRGLGRLRRRQRLPGLLGARRADRPQRPLAVRSPPTRPRAGVAGRRHRLLARRLRPAAGVDAPLRPVRRRATCASATGRRRATSCSPAPTSLATAPRQPPSMTSAGRDDVDRRRRAALRQRAAARDRRLGAGRRDHLVAGRGLVVDRRRAPGRPHGPMGARRVGKTRRARDHAGLRPTAAQPGDRGRSSPTTRQILTVQSSGVGGAVDDVAVLWPQWEPSAVGYGFGAYDYEQIAVSSLTLLSATIDEGVPTDLTGVA